ncbi:MAG: GGDEF domain-containing protein [Lachnospiraceae bacterium]|nr:GGDEF domain-containing protein [Lachnospiraceae bacterium]
MPSYSEWRYYGLSKERFDELSYRVSRDNIKFLRTASAAGAICASVFGLIFLLTPTERLRGIGLLIFAVIATLFNFIGWRLRNEDSRSVTGKVNGLIFWFQILILSICIYCGGILNEYPAALVVGGLIAIPIAFDVSPKRNIAVVLTSLVALGVCSFIFKDIISWTHDVVNGICASVMGLTISWKKSKDKWEHEDTLDLVEKRNIDLFKDSTTDPLTGLMNRRNAFERLEVLAAESHISNRPIVCMIMDVDYFKKYNDSYGHPEGDKLLAGLGQLLLNMASAYDVNISRIGGEEFMAFWFPVSASDSVKFAGDILAQVHELDHPEKDKGKHATISIGIFDAVAGDADTGEQIYIKADRAVYAAKENGRDRYEFYEPSMGMGDINGQ